MILALVLAATLSFPQKSDAVVGVSAIHLETGKRVSVRGGESFPMASVFKFPVGIAVLRQVDAGKLSLAKRVTITDFSPGHSPLRERAKGKPVTLTIGELLDLTVREGDNTAADTLLRMVGAHKEPGIRIDRTEKEIAAFLRTKGNDAFAADPRDTSTPDAMAGLLAKFWRRELGLSDASHKLLLRLMTEVTRGQRRLRAGAPKGSVVAHRTGTMAGTVNDVGVIAVPNGQHVAIAVFTKAAKTSAVELREDDIAAATKAALKALQQ